MKKSRIFFGIVVLVAGIGWMVTKKYPERGTKSVEATEFQELVKREEVFVLDVHIPEEIHIPGTDKFIPYNEIEGKFDQLPQDKQTPIAVYCRSGTMSREAAAALMRLGYTQVFELAGGTNAYKAQVSEVVLEPGGQNLGSVTYGEVSRLKYTLRNWTSQPLRITRISTSCGCTQATMANMQIAPFGEEEILVTFDPAVHKDDTDLGEVTRSIYLETDNDQVGMLEASFTAIVVKN